MLNVLQEINRQVNNSSALRYINSGGCAVFATMIASRLQAANFPVDIVVFSYSHNGRSNIENARNNLNNCGLDLSRIQNWYGEGVDFCHVMVEFDYDGKRWQYDGKELREEGVNDITSWGSYEKCESTMSLHDMTKLAENPHNWNHVFDRELIPFLSMLIDDAFESKVDLH